MEINSINSRSDASFLFCGEMELNLKTFIVLGGAGGIGVEICRKLVEHKVKNLVVLDCQRFSAELLSKFETHHSSTKIDYHQIDVTDSDELKNILKRLGDQYAPIDGIINSVGIFNDKNVDRTFQVNVYSVIHTTLIGLKIMGGNAESAAASKVILNIASLVGLEPWHVLPVYTASKHAIVGFTRAMSHKYYFDKYGIRLVVLCPGATDTAFVQQFKDNLVFPDESAAVDALREVPKQRPEIVAEHVVTLLKDADNGSVWISDKGKLQLINMTSYRLFE